MFILQTTTHMEIGYRSHRYYQIKVLFAYKLGHTHDNMTAPCASTMILLRKYIQMVHIL